MLLYFYPPPLLSLSSSVSSFYSKCFILCQGDGFPLSLFTLQRCWSCSASVFLFCSLCSPSSCVVCFYFTSWCRRCQICLLWICVFSNNVLESRMRGGMRVVSIYTSCSLVPKLNSPPLQLSTLESGCAPETLSDFGVKLKCEHFWEVWVTWSNLWGISICRTHHRLINWTTWKTHLLKNHYKCLLEKEIRYK